MVQNNGRAMICKMSRSLLWLVIMEIWSLERKVIGLVYTQILLFGVLFLSWVSDLFSFPYSQKYYFWELVVVIPA